MMLPPMAKTQKFDRRTLKAVGRERHDVGRREQCALPAAAAGHVESSRGRHGGWVI